MNKQDLISKIKQLDGVTQDERAYLINLVNTKKKYGLVWEDKPEDVEEQLRDNLPVLKEVKDKAIVNGEDNPNHILIEGDNLHALTALTFTHEGKIDVIYIDPPYNTGNKDFKYNDTFVDKEDSYRHSKWLSFMDKRLRIAKRLLSEKGVIFISIDDNEQAQLKMLCDEVFGELNFISDTIVTSNSSKNNANFISTIHEYLFCYSKNINELEKKWSVKKNNIDDFKKVSNNLLKSDLSQLEVQKELRQLTKYPKFYDFDHYTYVDKKGPFRASDLTAPNSKSFYNILHPVTKLPCKYGTRGWGFSETAIQKLINEDKILFGSDETTVPQLKNYLIDNEYQLPKSNVFFDSQSSTKWIKAQGFNFSFPKALEYINYIISIFPSKSATILDFFAGSGTTLHATMTLNAEDGGNRQCILVTNNENNICEEVTYERNKRVIEGYKNAKGDEVEGIKNNNLRYFRSEYVSRIKSLKNKKELTRLATELLCIKENCYEEVTTQYGVKNWTAIFESPIKQLIVIYDDLMIGDSIEIIKKLKENQQTDNRIKVYVFSNGQYPYTEDFEEVARFVDLCALPDAIYKAYQNVLPKTKRDIVPTLEDDETTDENLFNQSNS